MDNYPPYSGQDSKCKACGTTWLGAENDFARPYFVTMYKTSAFGRKEWLLRYCPNCSHTWREACVEHLPSDDAPQHGDMRVRDGRQEMFYIKEESHMPTEGYQPTAKKGEPMAGWITMPPPPKPE